MQEFGRVHNQEDDANEPKRYSMPCNVILGNKKKKDQVLATLAIFYLGTGWASVYPWEVVSGCLFITG